MYGGRTLAEQQSVLNFGIGRSKALTLPSRLRSQKGRFKDPQSPKIARTAPHHFLNNSKGLPGHCHSFRSFEKGLAGGGWRQAGPKIQHKKGPQNCVPLLIGGDMKRVQKRGLNLWHRKDFLAPTPSIRQPLFETSDSFFVVPFHIVARLV